MRLCWHTPVQIAHVATLFSQRLSLILFLKNTAQCRLQSCAFKHPMESATNGGYVLMLHQLLTAYVETPLHVRARTPWLGEVRQFVSQSPSS